MDPQSKRVFWYLNIGIANFLIFENLVNTPNFKITMFQKVHFFQLRYQIVKSNLSHTFLLMVNNYL